MLGLVSGAIAVLAMLAAAWQAWEANKSRRAAETSEREAQAARDETAKLEARATEAFERQALALEESNRLTREATRERPKLELTQTGGQRWILANNGTAIAHQVLLTAIGGIIHIEDTEPRDLHPGDSIPMAVAPVWGGTRPRIRIEQEDRTGPQPKPLTTEADIPQ